MNVMILGILMGLASLAGVAIWLAGKADRTVSDRMNSPDRVDGSRDPRAYTHHSSY